MATQFGVTGPSDLGAVVWETVNKTSSPISVDVPNQTGAVAEIIQYDTRYEFTGTCHGEAEPTPDTPGQFSYGGNTYCIDAIEEAGTYNQVKRWTVRGHAFANCHSVTPAGGTSNTNTQNNP